jgi:hypothetical protein
MEMEINPPPAEEATNPPQQDLSGSEAEQEPEFDLEVYQQEQSSPETEQHRLHHPQAMYQEPFGPSIPQYGLNIPHEGVVWAPLPDLPQMKPSRYPTWSSPVWPDSFETPMRDYPMALTNRGVLSDELTMKQYYPHMQSDLHARPHDSQSNISVLSLSETISGRLLERVGDVQGEAAGSGLGLGGVWPSSSKLILGDESSEAEDDMPHRLTFREYDQRTQKSLWAQLKARGRIGFSHAHKPQIIEQLMALDLEDARAAWDKSSKLKKV